MLQNVHAPPLRGRLVTSPPSHHPALTQPFRAPRRAVVTIPARVAGRERRAGAAARLRIVVDLVAVRVVSTRLGGVAFRELDGAGAVSVGALRRRVAAGREREPTKEARASPKWGTIWWEVGRRCRPESPSAHRMVGEDRKTMSSDHRLELLPEVAAAAIELDRRGLASPEAGWAAVLLAVVKAVEAVHLDLRVVSRAKWGELRVDFLPTDLADTLRVRPARAAVTAKASMVTCQVCGRAARGGADFDRELVEVLCVGHRAVPAAGDHARK